MQKYYFSTHFVSVNEPKRGGFFRVNYLFRLYGRLLLAEELTKCARYLLNTLVVYCIKNKLAAARSNYKFIIS